MGLARLQLDTLDFSDETLAAEAAAASSMELKQQVSERLAAHRSRRTPATGAGSAGLTPAAAGTQPVRARANKIAAAVADRYAQSQSYRDFLAAEAERAIYAANAAAEVAARNAEAVTAVQQQLLAELDLWNEPAVMSVGEPAGEITGETVASVEPVHVTQTPPVRTVSSAAIARVEEKSLPGFTVRLYEDSGARLIERQSSTTPQAARSAVLNDDETFELDEEIAFRQSPVFEAPAEPPVTIPANLIEFPRQLVAPRKARPRIAEGPLREEADAAPATTQLRIFEVEASQISTTLNAEIAAPAVPEWATIRLDAASTPAPAPREEIQLYVPLQAAPLNVRLMAAVVDGCILGAAVLGAACAFAYFATQLPAIPVLAVTAAATLLVLFVVYHMLFFTFSDATPGMRYARVGLCTFSDENPTRTEMRRRTWSILLATCPLGLGLLWALLDDDHLGWHDRMSRMYQRSY